MTTTNKIHYMLYEFEGRTGRKATAIYVGTKTRDILKEEWEAFQFFATDRAPTRETINGVPVYLVDDEEHLNVG